ncbi:MAG: pitrilysin family protein [Deinococcales bacterium]
MLQQLDNIFFSELDNGIRIAVEEMPWLPSVSLRFVLPSGTIYDVGGMEGSSVILCDWMERGAGDKDSRSLIDSFNDLGVRRGSGVDKESLAFSASCLAEVLSPTLALYADIIRCPILADDEFTSAQQVALESLASLDDEPVSRLFIALSEAFFKSVHGRSGYGSKEGLLASNPKQLRDDFKRRISPQGLIISAAGGLKAESFVAEIQNLFGDWQGATIPAPEFELAESSYHHLSEDTAQTQIGVAYRGIAPGQAGWEEDLIAMNALSGGMASRLFSEVREKRGLVYSVSASGRQLKGFGYNLAYAGTTPERAQETLSVLLAELSKLYEGIAEQEHERAKTGILSNLIMQGESSAARASSLARSYYLLGEPRSLEVSKVAISQKSLADVNRFLHAQPKPRFSVLTLGAKALEGVA